MGFLLVPIGHTGYIVLPFKQPLVAHPDLLDGHFQVLLEEDGVRQMPTVKTAHRRTVVIMVIIVDKGVMSGIIRVAPKRRAVRLLHGTAIFLFGKAP